jgi:predicted transcriptional regulator
MARRSPAAPQRGKTGVLSVRLDARMKRRLDRLAKASDRTASWLVQDAVASYLDAQEWQVAAIRDAVRDADERPTRSVSHDRVKAWVKSWGTEREIERPRWR